MPPKPEPKSDYMFWFLIMFLNLFTVLYVTRQDCVEACAPARTRGIGPNCSCLNDAGEWVAPTSKTPDQETDDAQRAP